MNYAKKLQLGSATLNKAKDLGASLVGICNIEELKKAPSFTMAPEMPGIDVGRRKSNLGLEPGEVYWPSGAKSAVVIAYAHGEDKPHLDWWYGRIDPPGNRIMVDINKKLAAWIEDTCSIKTYPLPYHVEKGGIFLKDAAVYAGLGCIGKNNVLITPEYGPRVRLRAMLLSEYLPGTGPREYNPCYACHAPCLQVCPEEAFNDKIYSEAEMGQAQLPGLTGNYSRDKCYVQMNTDNEVAEEKEVPEISSEPLKIIKYCRNCELACPVGRSRE